MRRGLTPPETVVEARPPKILKGVEKFSLEISQHKLSLLIWPASSMVAVSRIHPAQFWASLVAQMVKSPPAMQETLVQPLSKEDPLEKGMATHSSIVTWQIPWTEDPGGLQSMELQS